MTWKLITKVSQVVRGIDPGAPGLLVVDIQLSARPDVEWCEAFNAPSDVERSMAMHSPTVSGDHITIRAQKGDIPRDVKYVDSAIAFANKVMVETVVPRREAEVERKAQAKAARDQEIAEAQQILDEL